MIDFDQTATQLAASLLRTQRDYGSVEWEDLSGKTHTGTVVERDSNVVFVQAADGTMHALEDGDSYLRTASHSPLIDTGNKTWSGGTIWYMDLSKDEFVHFTPASRAIEIKKDGKLRMNPPYQKFGVDGVFAISTQWGSWFPSTQTTHIDSPEPLMAVVFKTSTVPDESFAEEVIWHQDVSLKNIRVVPAKVAERMIRRAPYANILNPDDDMVRYKNQKQAAGMFDKVPAPTTDGDYNDTLKNWLLQLGAYMAARITRLSTPEKMKWTVTHRPSIVYYMGRPLGVDITLSASSPQGYFYVQLRMEGSPQATEYVSRPHVVGPDKRKVPSRSHVMQTPVKARSYKRLIVDTLESIRLRIWGASEAALRSANMKSANHLSDGAVEFLRVIAYKKPKVLNMNDAQEALGAIGLRVDEATALISLTKGSTYNILPIRGVQRFENRGLGSNLTILFKTERSRNSALKKLNKVAEIVSTRPSNIRPGQIYIRGMSAVDSRAPGIYIEAGWVGTTAWVVNGFSGATSITVPLGFDGKGNQDPARNSDTYALKDALYSKGFSEAAFEYLMGQGIGEEGSISAPSTRSIEGTGTCPACFANVKLGRGDRIMRHGWSTMGDRRKGEYGRSWHTGACFGVGYKPYELSKEGTQDFRDQKFYPYYESLTAELEGVKTGTKPIRTDKGQVEPGTDEYAYLQPRAVTKLRRQVASAKTDLATLDARISAWEPRALPGTKTSSAKGGNRIDRATYIDRVAARLASENIVEMPHSFHKVNVEAPQAEPFVGYVDFQGLEIDIEVKANQYREKTNPEGVTWRRYMHHHYGEIRGTEGSDGDKLDVYVGPNHDSSLVVVIHQQRPDDRTYDEDKVMVGFDSVEEAIGAYKKHYPKPGFYAPGEHTAMPIGKFWRWCHNDRNKGKKVSSTKVAWQDNSEIESGLRWLKANRTGYQNITWRLSKGKYWVTIPHRKLGDVKFWVYAKPDHPAGPVAVFGTRVTGRLNQTYMTPDPMSNHPSYRDPRFGKELGDTMDIWLRSAMRQKVPAKPKPTGPTRADITTFLKRATTHLGGKAKRVRYDGLRKMWDVEPINRQREDHSYG